MPDQDDIIAAKKSIQADWLAKPGVTAIDVGLKYVGGKRTDTVAIRLYVRKKLTDIPPDQKFPAQVGPHPTDVLERTIKPCGPIPPDATYHNPMAGGVQIAIPEIEAASTAGMFVLDNITGQLMILGTFHGYAMPNAQVYQPQENSAGWPDGTEGQIGYYIRGGHYFNPPLDADLLIYGAPRAVEFQIEGIGYIKGVRPVTLEDLKMKLSVKKRGVWTGLTYGILEGIDMVPSVTYPPDYLGKSITYSGFLTFAPDAKTGSVYLDTDTNTAIFSHDGDSGSVIVDKDNYAIAILNASDDAVVDSNGRVIIPKGVTVYGQQLSQIMTALNISPCLQSTVLPRKVTLTFLEAPVRAPDSPGASFGLGGASDWGTIAYGSAETRPFPTCPVKSYKWSITNVYQTLNFRASVVCFIQPVFSWKINGQVLNTFDMSKYGNVSLNNVPISVPNPANFPAPLYLSETVTLKFFADNTAAYDVSGSFGFLYIYPTVPQGSIMLTVEVEVRELADVAGAQILTKSAPATLDTQLLVWEPSYYQDRAKCANWTAGHFNIPRHPWGLINFLLAQPDPPPDLTNATRLLIGLQKELSQLAATQPAAARELSRIFAQTLNVPAHWLSDTSQTSPAPTAIK